MSKGKKDFLKALAVIAVVYTVIVDIPIPRSMSKHGITVNYNHYLLNRVALDIYTLDHAAQNNFLRANAETELYRKLCHKYVETNDKEIAESLRIYYDRLNKTEKFDIDLVCARPAYFFRRRYIY